MEVVSLSLAHIVVMVYLCCPKQAMSEDLMFNSNPVVPSSDILL